MSRSVITSIAVSLCLAVVTYVGCSTNSSISNPPPPQSPPPHISPTPTIVASPQSASTTLPIPASATMLPIPQVSGFSGSFQLPSISASPGATVTITSYSKAPLSAPAPQAIARIPLRWAARAHRLSTGPTAIFWVSQQYSASLTFSGFPITTWQVPASDASGPLALETFDGTSNTLMDTEFDTSITGNTVTFPGSSATFAVVNGHTYWWELISGKAIPLQITSGSPPGGEVGAKYNGGSFALSASGGTPPFSWSWSAAAGSSLPPGLSVVGGAITGTPTAAGSYQVIVAVTDAGSPAQHVSASYTINVTQLQISSSAPPRGEVGVQYSGGAGGFTLAASGGTSPYSWSWTAASGSTLPPGLTTQAAGSIVGTPTTAGTYKVVVSVTDSATPRQHANAPYSITIIPAPPLLSTIEYQIPTASSGTNDITAGPDGNLWFTENVAGNIGKVTTGGGFNEYAQGGGPFNIIVGPDNNLWFIHDGDQVAQITTAGTISSFTLPGHIFAGIAAGPDGNLWLTDNHSIKCGKRCFRAISEIVVITTSGAFSTSFPVGTGSFFQRKGLAHIVTGSDGNLWFVEVAGNQIGKITTAGVVTEFPLPTASSGLSTILTRGPDGNIWFAENRADQVGKITPSGSITEFPLPSPFGGPLGIGAGPDGNVWFTENNISQLGKITAAGVITEFRLPTAASGPVGITKGPDGDVWFVESGANKIAKFKP